MLKEGIDRIRAEMYEYMEAEGLNQTEFAKLLGCGRASLGKFLREEQNDLRGGTLQRFRDVQGRRAVVAREPKVDYTPDDDDPWVGIAKELRELVEFLENETVTPDRKLERFENTVGHYFRLLVAFSASVTNST